MIINHRVIINQIAPIHGRLIQTEALDVRGI